MFARNFELWRAAGFLSVLSNPPEQRLGVAGGRSDAPALTHARGAEAACQQSRAGSIPGKWRCVAHLTPPCFRSNPCNLRYTACVAGIAGACQWSARTRSTHPLPHRRAGEVMECACILQTCFSQGNCVHVLLRHGNTAAQWLARSSGSDIADQEAWTAWTGRIRYMRETIVRGVDERLQPVLAKVQAAAAAASSGDRGGTTGAGPTLKDVQ